MKLKRSSCITWTTEEGIWWLRDKHGRARALLYLDKLDHMNFHAVGPLGASLESGFTLKEMRDTNRRRLMQRMEQYVWTMWLA